MYRLYCRIYQFIYRLVMYALPWREPKLLQGQNAIEQFPELIRNEQLKHVFIVTDKTIRGLSFFNSLLANLTDKHISFTIYDGVTPNPTIDSINEGRLAYLHNKAEAIIAIGGGSVIDCAKGIAATLARPNKSIPQLKGQLKVVKRTPKVFAVPTTSGTGSEATVAAVITDSQSLEKYAVNDLVLIPHYAVLDPTITLNLPPFITATTGMDALTHVVEAYIGGSTTAKTRQYSLDATKLIFTYLERAYQMGDDIEARAAMQTAAYKAGVAFTRSYVGNIHAIAHTLGGYYNIPHGLANAVIMPYVLRFYGEHVYSKLSQLAVAAGLGYTGASEEQLAILFIKEIEKMNARIGIPNKLKGIEEQHIATLVSRALAEANPLYPVPIIMNAAQMTAIYRSIMA